ncbi:MAG: excinuclease ABC subunit UvrC [Mariprofundaceae bacterium]|nr:excinuclease ABC subunit UvrC [Mariprofundaceae bacterium]
MWITAPITLHELPREPGVYRMLDSKRKVLYVGKARNLRKRVSSYFQRKPDSPRTQALVVLIRAIEFSITPSEAEALILEHNLIKQLKPRYNVLLKDSKSYPYILLHDELYPKLTMYRGKRDQAGEYFGPFPNSGAVHQTLHSMQSIFQLRDCNDASFANRTRPCIQHQIGRCSAPCCGVVTQAKYTQQVQDARHFLQGRNQSVLSQWQTDMLHASTTMNFELAAELRDRIKALRTILAGNEQSGLPDDVDAIIILRKPDSVYVSMGVRRAGCNLGTHSIAIKQAVDADDVEILQSLLIQRYQHENLPSEILFQCDSKILADLKALIKLLQSKHACTLRIPKRGARLQWLNEIQRTGEQQQAGRSNKNQQAAFEAVAGLFQLDATPKLIAAVDNAHLGGQQTVAAIVYGGWNGPEKQHYRRYQLDETGTANDVVDGDDYAAMQAVLSRFYRAIIEEKLPCPDLMLIDGGKGQLAVAIQEASRAGLSDLKQVGVAKGISRKLGEEVLWPSWSPNSLKPGIHSPALLLMARIRDEAHRFAGEYLRKRKKKSMFTSQLDRIEGIGSAKRAMLLKHFGGIDGIKKASRSQLAQVQGVSSILAERIFKALHA